jgi:hypothetical protein
MTALHKIVSDHLTETADVRVLTKKYGGLLGPEYLIGYGDRHFVVGALTLKLLQTGTPFEDLEGSLLEVDADGEPVEGAS